MRTPFVRPFFAKFFYILAFLGGSTALFLVLVEVLGIYKVLGSKFAVMLATYGLFSTLMIAGSSLALAAIGYVIELLAKIEWNTRPNADGSGYVGSPASGPLPLMADKQYFLSEKGRVTGPLNAAELLALYRDGKISIAAQISVEEGGQRRLLKNLSEIGL